MTLAAKRIPSVVLVTDPAYGDDVIVRVVSACAEALPAGAFAVQLRDKKRARASLRPFAARLRLATKSHGAILLVNGDVELARDIGADGAHLGGDAVPVSQARAILGEEALVTIAAHSDEAVRSGLADGADGAFVSPIFASPGKGQGRGTDAVRSARAIAPPSFALYALGGVDRTNATACVDAGATGAACIRALLLAEDPAAEARALHGAIVDARGRFAC